MRKGASQGGSGGSSLPTAPAGACTAGTSSRVATSRCAIPGGGTAWGKTHVNNAAGAPHPEPSAAPPTDPGGGTSHGARIGARPPGAVCPERGAPGAWNGAQRASLGGDGGGRACRGEQVRAVRAGSGAGGSAPGAGRMSRCVQRRMPSWPGDRSMGWVEDSGDAMGPPARRSLGVRKAHVRTRLGWPSCACRWHLTWARQGGRSVEHF